MLEWHGWVFLEEIEELRWQGAGEPEMLWVDCGARHCVVVVLDGLIDRLIDNVM